MIRLVATLLAAVCGCALAGAPAARSATLPVTDPASFATALASAQPGDTISLAPGIYPSLTVAHRKFKNPVQIVGTRSVQIGEIDFQNSKGLVLSGVTITPVANVRAMVWVTNNSSQITIDNVLFNGQNQTLGAFLKTDPGTSDVTLQHSELTNCGQKGKCVDLGATNLQVLNNNFHDCLSCIFIKGSGDGALVRGNTFQGTGPGSCVGGEASCPHNDEIAIFGGGPWTIVGNRFGDMKQGTAQIYVQSGNHPTHDVLIADNIFGGDAPYAVRVGTGGGPQPPSNVRIVNNTMLSGHLASLRLNEQWSTETARPVIANNIFATLSSSNCGKATFVSNLTFSGTSCGGSVGKITLNASGAPIASVGLITRANPQYAPKTDFFGHPWKGLPNLGAVAVGDSAGPVGPSLTLPAQLGRHFADLKAANWHLSVALTLSGVTVVRAHLTASGYNSPELMKSVAGKTKYTLVFPKLPRNVRHAGQLLLHVTATTGSKTITKTVKVVVF